ncbi:hypothetical protein [Actinocorallia libanotica]|uniref:Uncharacterized protein n=1 Tax=Actinocorallia libanotica TaxID=46162 RepID=A0ABP4C0P3_9ACTN
MPRARTTLGAALAAVLVAWSMAVVGIGLELTTAMRMYDYGHRSAVVVCIIDQGSAIVRRKIS